MSPNFFLIKTVLTFFNMKPMNRADFIGELDSYTSNLLEILYLVALEIVVILLVFVQKSPIYFYVISCLILIVLMILHKNASEKTILEIVMYFSAIWILYSIFYYTNFMSKKNDSSESTIPDFDLPHILITLLIYVPSIITTFTMLNKWDLFMRIYTIIMFSTLLLPMTNAVLFLNPANSIARNILAIAISQIHRAKEYYRRKTRADRNFRYSDTKSVSYNIAVCNVFYVYFGYFKIVAIVSTFHILALIYELIKSARMSNEQIRKSVNSSDVPKGTV